MKTSKKKLRLIEKERLRKERFEQLLAATTEQYKAVFKALA